METMSGVGGWEGGGGGGRWETAGARAREAKPPMVDVPASPEERPPNGTETQPTGPDWTAKALALLGSKLGTALS